MNTNGNWERIPKINRNVLKLTDEWVFHDTKDLVKNS